jgi:dolichol-phosphate mannosyltransferase
LVAARGKLRVVELPYILRERRQGESKLNSLIAVDFFGVIFAKLTNDAVPPRFALFALVGLVGLLVHLAALYLAREVLDLAFAHAQTLAAIVAMINNYALNNHFTYGDQRLNGAEFVRGLVVFCILCSVGVIANVGVAFSLYSQQQIWWLAGIAGALMGAVWNYAMSSLFVWRLR